MKIAQIMVHGSAHGFAGGAQKVFINLGNSLSRRGHEVLSIYNDIKPGQMFFQSDDAVDLVNLNTPSQGPFHKGWKVLREIIKPLSNSRYSEYFPNPVHIESIRLLSRPMRKVIEDFQPDIIVAYGYRDHHSVSLALKGSACSQTPVIQMVHSEVHSYYRGLSHSDKQRLKECSAVQVLTPGFAKDFSELIGREAVFIPNIVFPPEKYVDLSREKTKRRIIMHSRFDKKKQQDLLLESFALIKNDFPDWELAIFGGGSAEYTEKLRGIVSSNHMSDQVFVSDPVSDTLSELCRSDIFAFSSVHEEGFPLALSEAMSVGLPCLGIESTSAVNFLISSENAGLLSRNDVQDFSAHLRSLMSDVQLRIKYGQNAKLGMEKYNVDNVCEQWINLFSKILLN